MVARHSGVRTALGPRSRGFSPAEAVGPTGPGYHTGMGDHGTDEKLRRALSRLTLIADLSEALAGTLDAHEALDRVCRLLAQRLGDWCAIDLVADEGSLERACASVRKVASGQCRWEAVAPCPKPEAAEAVGGALRTTKPTLLSESDLRDPACDEAWMSAFVGDLARHGATSVILTPLRARRQVAGILTLARCSDPPLGQAEFAIAKGLAHRVSLGLENARLHAEAENIAERLQRSLLPELPELPDVSAAARYIPAGTAAQVGGDWYDMFVLPDGGPCALIVGDVVGHDLHAAITMSQVRSMLRGIACDRKEPPGYIVRRLDTAMGTLCPETYATCVYALLQQDGARGAHYLDYTAAGHPPPLLINADGTARFLEGGHGPLLGLDPNVPRTSARVALPAGAAVLFYSDGLIERRGEPLDHGLTRLRRQATALAGEAPDVLCDRLLESMSQGTEDDVVLLAVRVEGAPPGP